MPNELALAPNEFQTIALAWIGALTVIISALAVAVLKIGPLVANVKSLFKLSEQQDARLTSQATRITSVALAQQPQSLVTAPSPSLVRPEGDVIVNNSGD